MNNSKNTSKIKIYDTNSNIQYCGLLANELIEYYKSFPDLVNQLTLREIDLITKLLEKYISKITIDCIWTDCHYENSIDKVWSHIVTCSKLPIKTEIIKENPIEIDYSTLNKKYIQLKKLRPYQVDYLESMNESYLKENRYIESELSYNLKEFIDFKSQTWDILEDTISWKLFKTTDEETGLSALKASIIISCNVKDLFYFLDDFENYSKFFKFTETAYMIRQINSTTKLFYLLVKPGFGRTDFIGINQVYLKDKSITILRKSLDEEESPNKYSISSEIRRGFLYNEVFILNNLDDFTCELEYYLHVDYGLEDEYDEVKNELFKYSFTILKNIKKVMEGKIYN